MEVEVFLTIDITISLIKVVKFYRTRKDAARQYRENVRRDRALAVVLLLSTAIRGSTWSKKYRNTELRFARRNRCEVVN